MNRSANEDRSENPFQSPADAPEEYLVRGGGICPYCGDSNFDRPYFTQWGGYIGPWLLKHGVCRNCGRGFNIRSGTSNLRNIAIYQIGSVLLVFAATAVCLFYFLPTWRFWP
ncbi:MAG: hypothetical protein ACIALR_04870 [Blastopirellula sp. JB062]